MTNNAKATLTPKLRFPAFRSAGTWTVEPLGNICDVLNNRRRPISSDQRLSGPYPYYGASGIVDYVGEFIFDERLLLVGEDGAKWEAFEKTAFIAEGKYWVNNHAHVLKPTGVNDALLENYLTMANLGPFVTGAAPPKLTLGKLKSIPIPIPESLAEQQKIAECLSTLEELIVATSQKLDALKTHKKGLMQQLFPREGETLPRLRFTKFRDPWGKTTLGKLSTSISSGRDERATEGLFDLYGSTGVIGQTSIGTFNGKFLLVARVGANAGLLTKVSGSFGVTDNTLVIDLTDKKNNDFIFHYLRNFDLNRMIFGSGQPLITGGQLKAFPILLPSNSEREDIASCLSSLDELVAAQSGKLEALKTHKKGLMQQLFPSPAEAGA